MPRPYFYNGQMIGKGAGAEPSSIPALTNGQLAIGSTGYPPVPASITGAGGIVVTGGAGTLALTTRGFVSTTVIGNVLTGEDTLQTWTMPANTIVAHSGLQIDSLLSFAANGNTKTAKLYVGGSVVTLNPVTVAPNGAFLSVRLRLWWSSATVGLLEGPIFLNPTALEAVFATVVNTTVDFTAPLVIKFTGEATATDDVRQLAVAMTAFRTP